MNVSFRQLKAFVQTSQSGSFSAAAQVLGMTQPALSQQIRQMEETLGLALFHRTTRRVALTVAGQEMLDKARRTLHQVDDFNRHADDLHAGRQGTLTLGVIASVACSLLPQALVGFAAACPGVRLLFEEEPAALLLERVRHGELELGWGLYPTPHDDLAFEPLGRDQMVAVMHTGHALAQRERVSWDDLRQHKLVSASRQSGVRIYAERAAEIAGVVLQPSYQTGSLSTGMALVRCGLGCAVMPALSLGSLNQDNVVVLPMEQPGVWREIGLIQRQGWPLSPAASAFAHLARNVIWPPTLPASQPLGPR